MKVNQTLDQVKAEMIKDLKYHNAKEGDERISKEEIKRKVNS